MTTRVHAPMTGAVQSWDSPHEEALKGGPISAFTMKLPADESKAVGSVPHRDGAFVPIGSMRTATAPLPPQNDNNPS